MFGLENAQSLVGVFVTMGICWALSEKRSAFPWKLAIGAIADFVRQRKVGNRASYIVNRYINYSNYCILSCQFCSFARKKRDADGFEFTVEQIVDKAREALKLGEVAGARLLLQYLAMN